MFNITYLYIICSIFLNMCTYFELLLININYLALYIDMFLIFFKLQNPNKYIVLNRLNLCKVQKLPTLLCFHIDEINRWMSWPNLVGARGSLGWKVVEIYNLVKKWCANLRRIVLPTLDNDYWVTNKVLNHVHQLHDDNQEISWSVNICHISFI